MTDVRESSGSAAFTPEIAVRAVSERRDRVGFRRIFYYWAKETKEGKRAVQRQFQRTQCVDTGTRREYNQFQLLSY